jgi:uncharacterized membrane protein YdjX (TVP38/TMEM64 family)
MPDVVSPTVQESPPSAAAESQRSGFVHLFTSPSFYLLFAVVVVGTLVGGWLLNNYGVQVVRQSLGKWAPLVTVPIHIIVAVSPLPSDIVSIANGAVYGFAAGTGLSWFAWWIAAILEFGLGYRVRADFHFEDHINRIPKWLRRFPVSHPVYLIGARQIPWIGGHITSFVPGASGVSLKRYVWCSAIAVIPGSIVMAAIGAELMKL